MTCFSIVHDFQGVYGRFEDSTWLLSMLACWTLEPQCGEAQRKSKLNIEGCACEIGTQYLLIKSLQKLSFHATNAARAQKKLSSDAQVFFLEVNDLGKITLFMNCSTVVSIFEMRVNKPWCFIMHVQPLQLELRYIICQLALRYATRHLALRYIALHSS